MKLFLFLLLLLAPPPPTFTTSSTSPSVSVSPPTDNHTATSTTTTKAVIPDNNKNDEADKIKALPNDEQPSLSNLFSGLLESFLEPESQRNDHSNNDDTESQNNRTEFSDALNKNNNNEGGSSPEDDEDEEDESSTSAESSSESNKNSPDKLRNGNNEPSQSSESSKEGAIRNSNSNSNSKNSGAVCPGACVLPTLAGNCEAVLTTEDICTANLQCCVSKDKHKDHPDLLEIKKKPIKPCAGECRNALVGLFLCDDIDAEATCGDSSQSCCMMKPKTPPPQRFPQGPGPPPGPIQPDYSEEEQDRDDPPPPPSFEQQPQTTPRPVSRNPTRQSFPPPLQQQPPPPQYPPQQGGPPPQYRPMPMPCPAYCLPRFLSNHCSQKIPNHHCGVNAFCCAHDYRPPPMPKTTTPPPEPEEEEEEETPRAPCPGSCLSLALSFSCFLNAEMTDAFSCPSPGSRCCAPKTALNITTTTAKPLLQPILPIYTSPRPPPPPGYPPPHPGNFDGLPIPTSQPKIGQSPPFSPYVCGMKGPPSPGRRRKRVVGGRDSSPGEWCWQVALINSLNQYLCGGALIGTEFVLTAAHCVTNIVRSGDAIYVRVGDHDLTSKYGSPGAQTLRVATTYIHHNHNSQTLDNDIALLKLQGNVALKQGVCLVCLPNKTGLELPGKRCVVTGYGYMGESGPIPLRVREAELPIVGESECIDKVNAVTEKRFVLPASSFCAGGEFKNDACQGDGGGPLVCKVHDGMYELTGLVSWGFGCGRQDVPGVYVKVSSFIGWINQIISINGGGIA